MVWPEERGESYDADLVWDEGSETWIANDARGGAQYQNQLVIVNNQGQIYFGEV